MRGGSEHGLWRLAALAAVLIAAAPSDAAAASTPSASPPASAIGQEDVTSIAVSPVYRRTGFIIAMTAPVGHCSSSHCEQLRVSHNGGASWGLAHGDGWQGGQPAIAVDATGHEILFAVSSAGLQRSDDEGDTWGPSAGTSGGSFVTPVPRSSHGVAAAVAAGRQDWSDYLAGSTGIKRVNGSGGSLVDLSFAFSPAYPSGGGTTPAFLSAMDPHTNLPVVERCSVDLACSGVATLSGASQYPANLLLSSGYAADGVLFAQTARGVYKSSNGGQTFAQIPLVPNDGAATTATPMIALAPGYNERGAVHTLFAAVFQIYTDVKNPHTGGGVFTSDDGGATWTKMNTGTPLDDGAVAVTVAPDGRLFAAYLEQSQVQAGAGLLCSSDGRLWSPSCPPVGSRAAVIGDHAYGANAAGVAQPTANGRCPSGPCKRQPDPTAQPSGAGGGDAETGGTTGSTSAPLASPRFGGGPVWPIPLGAGVAACGLAVLLWRRHLRRRRPV